VKRARQTRPDHSGKVDAPVKAKSVTAGETAIPPMSQRAGSTPSARSNHILGRRQFHVCGRCRHGWLKTPKPAKGPVCRKYLHARIDSGAF